MRSTLPHRALLNNHKANKQKKRKEIWLIVDLRMLNNFFCGSQTSNIGDDVWAADTLIGKKTFFSFNLKSAYQHNVIDPKYYNYFGFSWKNDKQ